MANRVEPLSTWKLMEYQRRYDTLLTLTTEQRAARFEQKLQTEYNIHLRSQKHLREDMQADYDRYRARLDTQGHRLAMGGEGAVLQENFITLLNQAWKMRSNQKVRSAAGFGHQAFDVLFDRVVLVANEYALHIEMNAIEDGEWTTRCLTLRIGARCPQPFRVIVNLKDLRDIVKLMDRYRLDLEYRHFIQRLVIRHPGNVTRLPVFDPV